ncbi:MAG: DUF4132 domain-containing protein [Arachnia sp.]
MVFDKLKRLFGGITERDDAPKRLDLMHAALRPLDAHAAGLTDRCVAYVRQGDDAVVLELQRAGRDEPVQLLHNPGCVGTWWWPTPPTAEAWKSMGLTATQVESARSDYYASQPSTEELVRFGRLLAALNPGVNRRVEGVPVWVTALINDVAVTYPDRGPDVRPFADRLPRWRAPFVAELLAADGAPPDEAVRLAILAIAQAPEDSGSRRCLPNSFPGVDDLLAQGGVLTPADAARLNAEGRTWLMGRAEQTPAVGAALAPVVAALTLDTAKGPRAAALRALQALPPEVRAGAIRPVLAAAAPGRAAELVDLLGRVPGGPELLAEAVADGARIGAVVEQSALRLQAIEAEATDEPLLLPPFEPVPEARVGRETVAQLRAALAAEIARCEGRDITWARYALERARKVRDADLVEAVAAANGDTDSCRLLGIYNLWWISSAGPSLNLIHLFRLTRIGQHRYKLNAPGMRREQVTDLRAVEDAARRAGVHADQLGPDGISEDNLASYAVGRYPDEAWPWFAGHLHILERWLGGEAGEVTSALQVLGQFPTLPQRLLPLVARVAVSESRTNRPLAQAALRSHPAALALASQGLADGKGEIRAAAAGWMADLGQADGIRPLRAALAKEKRPAAQAAMLTALERLGDDISADLAPERLVADARKGLKAKPPTSMDWLNLDLLPAARWANGDAADPALLRWWAVLAVKLKDPDGSGLFDRYLSLLDPDDAAELGRFALRAWIAQDTRRPTEAESRAHAATLGPQRWQNTQDYARRIAGSPHAGSPWEQQMLERAQLPVEAFVEEAFREDQDRLVGSATADKGLLALTTRLPGIELANAVQSYIRNFGGRRAQVETLVHALFGNGDPAAVQLLLSISRRFKQATVQAKARELVERLADERGWSPDELADRTIPTAGFGDDRLLRLSFGAREFIGRVNAAFGIDLTDPDGKAIKTLPAPRVADDADAAAEAKKQLGTARKELKAVLGLQAARLYEAMCAGRSWAAADWREFIAGHPLMAQLATRLIWESAGRRFRPTEDGELIDLEDEAVELGDGDVRLAHRVRMTPEEAASWTAHLRDYAVKPLFDQLTATTPSFSEGAVELSDLRGHMTDTFTFRGVATKRGYTRGYAEDGGWFTHYSKEFSSAGLTAMLEFTGSYLPEDNIPCATDTLSFHRAHRPVPLSEVPDVLLAECYADYAALAALGPFDPDFRDKAGL